MSTIRAASDVGGTFTDLVYFVIDEQSGKITDIKTEKTHTTPPKFEVGVMTGFDKANIDLADVSFFAHGSTVVINALTERKGVKVALITTAGFRDVLEIGRGNRPDFFNLRYKKPEPFVPRHLRQEVRERINYKGEILQPLEMDDIDGVIEGFLREGVQAVAISLLHSYVNTSHEEAVANYIKEKWPQLSVVASHQISREWREYERSNTAAVCAYVQPATERYLSKMNDALEHGKFNGAFYVMQSNGGIDTVAATKKTPISIVESGPASGVLGAASLGQLLGLKNIIAFDIGGTTAKCSLIDDGNVSITSQYMIEKDGKSAGYPIMTPVVDIVEIGNGGGSIGWVDEYKKLHVGPQSAGALPGPVAYAKGGTEPTTTDANLLLSRINPEFFIGGEIQADMQAVETSFEKLGEQIGLSARDAARGVVNIANNNMTNALKLVSINRGHDPRDFTMIAFGGGGAMHATQLAAELNIPTVVIPAHSAVFSAWGMLLSDLRRDYIRTRPSALNSGMADDLFNVFVDMEREARLAYEQEQIDSDRVYIEKFVSLRYKGQEHSVRVSVPNEEMDAEKVEDLMARFRQAYEKEYSYRLDNDIEIVSYYVVAYARVDKPTLDKIPPSDSADIAIKSYREVDFDTSGIIKTAIYDRELLGSGVSFDGPAIVEESGSTTVVFPDQHVDVDDYGNLHITI